MPLPPRKKAEDALLLALACGATVENASRQCGLSERTIYRRLKDTAFRRRVEDERSLMLVRSVQRLSAIGRTAVEKLAELMRSKKAPPSVQHSHLAAPHRNVDHDDTWMMLAVGLAAVGFAIRRARP